MIREKSGARVRKRCRGMRFHYYSYFFIIILFSVPVIAQDYLALQGSASGSGGGTGSIVVEIWSAATSGSLLYNSSNDFNNVISSSRYDILLGNGTNPLSLNFSGTYYMEMYINGRDIDFNSSERQVFQSPVGNITVTTPIKTTNRLNVNDFFNITGVTSEVRTNGTVTILNTDVDDALNVTGGAFVGGDTSVNRFFNITTTASTVRTNGTVTILSILAPAFTLNNGFNISGTSEALVTNGSISIQNPSLAPAFTLNNGFNISGTSEALVTNGSISIQNPSLALAFTLNNGFNISGTSEALVTNGSISIQNPSLAPAFTINNGFNISGTGTGVRTNESITIISTDDDDGLNVTGGLFIGSGNAGAQFGIGSFTISDVGVITTDTAIGPAAGRGNIVINSLTAQALSINSGFNVSGPTLAMTTNGTVTIQSLASPALSIQGFNVSGASGALRTNGTVTILNTDDDDGLNVTGGLFIGSGNTGAQFGIGSFTISDVGVITTDSLIGPAAGRGNIVINSLTAQALSINSGFNVSGPTLAMRTNSTVTILSSDSDDALNVTGSMASQGATITIGNADSTTQHRLEVFDGGVNKCAYIRLFADNGADYFLFANSTGQLRMANDAPSSGGDCNTLGAGVGGQAG